MIFMLSNKSRLSSWHLKSPQIDSKIFSLKSNVKHITLSNISRFARQVCLQKWIKLEWHPSVSKKRLRMIFFQSIQWRVYMAKWYLYFFFPLLPHLLRYLRLEDEFKYSNKVISLFANWACRNLKQSYSVTARSLLSLRFFLATIRHIISETIYYFIFSFNHLFTNKRFRPFLTYFTAFLWYLRSFGCV